MRIGAVVTTYHPDVHLQHLLRALSPQVQHVVIVDNTPGAVPDVLAAVRGHGPRVVRLGSNRGLAAALNVGLDELRELGCELAVLWDQDSLPCDHYVERLLQAAQSSPAWPDVLAAGVRRGAPQQRQEFSPVATVRLITSGMLLPLAVADAVGPFREEFFVDAVDTDFSLRARARGVSCLHVPALVFEHQFGEQTAGSGPLARRATGHSVWRQYCIARNEAVLLREFRDRDPEAVRSVAANRRRWFLRALLAGPLRFATAVAVARGLLDARRGRIDARYLPSVVEQGTP